MIQKDKVHLLYVVHMMPNYYVLHDQKSMSIIFSVSYFNYLSQRHFQVFFNNELSLVCNKNRLCSMTCGTGSPKYKSEEKALDPIQKINMGEKKMEKDQIIFVKNLGSTIFFRGGSLALNPTIIRPTTPVL